MFGTSTLAVGGFAGTVELASLSLSFILGRAVEGRGAAIAIALVYLWDVVAALQSLSVWPDTPEAPELPSSMVDKIDAFGGWEFSTPLKPLQSPNFHDGDNSLCLPNPSGGDAAFGLC